MSLSKFWDRISRHQKTAAGWDDAVIMAGKQGKDGVAAQLMDAARRDYKRANFYWDFEESYTLFPASIPDSLEFLAGKMNGAAAQIRQAAEAGAGDGDAIHAEALWDLSEVKAALLVLLEGVCD